MDSEEIQFYLRHRRQITEWAGLEARTEALMRDAVRKGAEDDAIKLMKGNFGEVEADFYIRNQSLIKQWDSLQTAAGDILHDALLAAAGNLGLPGGVGKMGWTTIHAVLDSSPLHRHHIQLELAWTKGHLLTTRKGYPSPRIALSLPPAKWNDERRSRLVGATRLVAHELGMTRRDKWWAHWGILDEISEGQDLHSYADQCLDTLVTAREHLFPIILEVLPSLPTQTQA